MRLDEMKDMVGKQNRMIMSCSKRMVTIEVSKSAKG
jgi:hypothetical protein